MVRSEVPGGSVSPGRLFSKRNQGMAQSTMHTARSQSRVRSPMIRPSYAHHIPPAKAIKVLNALVLFSVLWSDLTAFKIPTMTARIMISPSEQTANETFDIRLRCRDSNSAWSPVLGLSWVACQQLEGLKSRFDIVLHFLGRLLNFRQISSQSREGSRPEGECSLVCDHCQSVADKMHVSCDSWTPHNVQEDSHPSIYRATPAFHFEASSTPSQAKETATATTVKKIVMFGLGMQVLRTAMHSYSERCVLHTSSSRNLPKHRWL